MSAPGTQGTTPPPTVVSLLDPVAASQRGAFAYHDAAGELPDAQPQPVLRVRREVTAPGCRLRLEPYAGDEPGPAHTVEVTRAALDRAACPPRRRVHPAERTVLELRSSRHLDVAELGAASDTHDGDVEVAWLPRHGPGPRDTDRIAQRARTRRCVRVPAPLEGEPVLVAALLLRLVAGGTACLVAPSAAAQLELLSPALVDALTGSTGGTATGGHLGDPREDDLALAALAARQKRAAWRDHDLELRWRPAGTDPGAGGGTDPGAGGTVPGAWLPGLHPPRRPGVSVVLTSRRPELVPTALSMIAAQRDVDLEVVVALHGAGDAAQVERQLVAAGLEGRALQADAAVPFGAVVDAAIEASSGELVLKWDDDDLYGPDHVLDLLLAQRQTGAGLVGKAPEFVHLESAGVTVWRTPGRAEAPSLGLAGGTLLTPRAVLDDIGGYPPVTRAIDHHLKHRIEAAGAGVFRTHGFGFVLRRHAHGHTWDADEERYLARAVRRFDGLPALLELGAAARHTSLGGAHDG